MSDWGLGPAWLFCPADRPERYSKALDRADVVIVDLEDAVAPDRKDAAREAVRRLAEQQTLDLARTVVRVNASDSRDHADDLRLTADLGVRFVMLAKAEDWRAVSAIDAQVVPLIETPRGVAGAAALAEPPNVLGLMWGADDLVASMGGTSSRHPDGAYRDVARFARSQTLLAAKARGRLALDAVHMDIVDLDGLREECEDAAAVGFDGTVAIHPSQVPVIRSCYAPSEEEVAWARRLLQHVGTVRGVTTFEGRMVDGPVFKQAERLLQLAGRRTTGNRRDAPAPAPE